MKFTVNLANTTDLESAPVGTYFMEGSEGLYVIHPQKCATSLHSGCYRSLYSFRQGSIRIIPKGSKITLEV